MDGRKAYATLGVCSPSPRTPRGGGGVFSSQSPSSSLAATPQSAPLGELVFGGRRYTGLRHIRSQRDVLEARRRYQRKRARRAAGATSTTTNEGGGGRETIDPMILDGPGGERDPDAPDPRFSFVKDHLQVILTRRARLGFDEGVFAPPAAGDDDDDGALSDDDRPNRFTDLPDHLDAGEFCER